MEKAKQFEAHRVTIFCSRCERDATIKWDFEKDGYKTFCPYCGERVMMCNHCDRIENCDYDKDTDTCRYSRSMVPANSTQKESTMEKKVSWDDNHGEHGWWILTISENSVTLYDWKKFYKKPDVDFKFCYSGIMPKGSMVHTKALEATSLEDAKRELLEIYFNQMKLQTQHCQEIINDNALASAEIRSILEPNIPRFGSVKKQCPKCGYSVFGVTAHVTQDWLVDGDGDFLKSTNECVEVTHQPDDEDIWTCANCGYEAAGKEFNIKENNL